MNNGCENCKHYINDRMDCRKGNLSDENIFFDGENWRVKCHDWEEIQCD